MTLETIGQAIGLFAVTNIDDLVILAVFFAITKRPGQVVAGQYLGFAGILVVAGAAAYGATFLPAGWLRWLGLLPLALGVKAAWQAWRAQPEEEPKAAGWWQVAGVTFANGGDNIGVYVPVFANAGMATATVYIGVFLALVAGWCAAGRFLATRQVVARTLSRWGHVVLPIVLIGLGLAILL